MGIGQSSMSGMFSAIEGAATKIIGARALNYVKGIGDLASNKLQQNTPEQPKPSTPENTPVDSPKSPSTGEAQVNEQQQQQTSWKPAERISDDDMRRMTGVYKLMSDRASLTANNIIEARASQKYSFKNRLEKKDDSLMHVVTTGGK